MTERRVKNGKNQCKGARRVRQHRGSKKENREKRKDARLSSPLFFLLTGSSRVFRGRRFGARFRLATVRSSMVRAVGLYPTGCGFESHRTDHVKTAPVRERFLREPRGVPRSGTLYGATRIHDRGSRCAPFYGVARPKNNTPRAKARGISPERTAHRPYRHITQRRPPSCHPGPGAGIQNGRTRCFSGS